MDNRHWSWTCPLPILKEDLYLKHAFGLTLSAPGPIVKPSTCPPKINDVFRIPPSVGMLFFHSGQPIGSVDMCHQIKHVRFLDFLDFKDD